MEYEAEREREGERDLSDSTRVRASISAKLPSAGRNGHFLDMCIGSSNFTTVEILYYGLVKTLNTPHFLHPNTKSYTLSQVLSMCVEQDHIMRIDVLGLRGSHKPW